MGAGVVMVVVIRTVRTREFPPGFSLIELLVAMAIIGLLLAILLPAVLNVIEGARRARCLNHLRQLGLALHNYSEAHGTLPIGARAQRGFGPSWFVGLLPYVDQADLFNRFDADSPNNGAPVLPPPFGSRNGQILNGKIVPAFWCPSSTLTQMVPAGPTSSVQAAAFVGISGAHPAVGEPADRSTACCKENDNNGSIASGGALFPNGSVSFKDFTDGTSNVMVVGEQSALLFDSPKRIDGGYPNGWSCGTIGVGVPPQYRSTAAGSPTVPAFNLATIRHAPNSSYFQDGVLDIRGPNNPLSSSHEGGVNILLGDGSTRMMNENIGLDIQRHLAVRDDGYRVDDF